MLKLGSTTLPLAGWVADPRYPEEGRAKRLLAIRHLIEGLGLSAVELTADLTVVFPQIFDRHFYTSVADLQAELGFHCSVHLPFLWVDLCSLNESLRQSSLETMYRVLETVKPVEVDTFVLHLWGFTASQIVAALDEPSQLEAIVAALLAQGRRSLEQLSEVVEPDRVCLENLEDSLFARAWPLLSDAGTSICLDVGHLLWQGGDLLDFLFLHGDRIAEVHLHDALRASAASGPAVRDHLRLGCGQVDYGSLLESLKERGFDGPVILEVNSRSDLEESIAAVRHWF